MMRKRGVGMSGDIHVRLLWQLLSKHVFEMLDIFLGTCYQEEVGEQGLKSSNVLFGLRLGHPMRKARIQCFERVDVRGLLPGETVPGMGIVLSLLLFLVLAQKPLKFWVQGVDRGNVGFLLRGEGAVVTLVEKQSALYSCLVLHGNYHDCREKRCHTFLLR